jgi:phosphate transport system protein
MRAIRGELKESDDRVHQVNIEGYPRKNQQRLVGREANLIPEERLELLKKAVSSLANIVGVAFGSSRKSLEIKDLVLAKQVVQNDRNVDLREFAIREDCMKIIADGSLAKDDLREIITILGIITEIERMGDYAEGIANIALMIGDEPSLEIPAGISEMADMAMKMLRESIQAFLRKNVEEAKTVCRADDEVDAQYDKVFHGLLFSIVKEPKMVTQATRLIWVAHNMERFADRATNICEWVVFSVTGQIADIEASKY